MQNTEQTGPDWIFDSKLGGRMQAKAGSSSETRTVRTQPTRFVEHMQQLFGEDPDPVLLEESWALGVAAAVENHNRRRRQRANLPTAVAAYGDDRALRELERMAALGGDVEEFLDERSQPVSRRYAPAWMERAERDATEFHKSPPCAVMISAGETDAHAVLGVRQHASREEIRSAYRRRVGECHPDRLQDASETVRRQATQQLAEVNAAYRAVCEQICQAA